MKHFQHQVFIKRQSPFKNKTADTLIFSQILSGLMIKICATFRGLNEWKESRFMSLSGKNKASILTMFRFFYYYFFFNLNSWLESLNNTVLQFKYYNNGSNVINSLVVFVVYQPVHVVITLLISGGDFLPFCWRRVVEQTEWNCFLGFTGEISKKTQELNLYLNLESSWDPDGKTFLVS